MPKKAPEKYARDQEILDRFSTKAEYKAFLNKKIKDFTADEKRLYNRIAQQEKRNPFGKELAATSTFIPVGQMPFATTPIVEPPPAPPAPPPAEYIPTIGDLRAVLRQAGALDRTPPQLNLTPVAVAAPKEDEVRGINLLPVSERRTERQLANDINLQLYGAERLGLGDDRSAFLEALNIIGDKKRTERAEELMAELARYEVPPPIEEARRLVNEAIAEYDRPARAESARLRDERKELMDSEVGDLKRALDEFNIPSDFLLKPTKRESRKAILKKNAPDWYERNIPVPVSPREKRTDLQFGLADPDDEFDPDPVVEFDEDEEWMKEYLREDVLEATARQRIKEGTQIDPRPRRRALASGLDPKIVDELYGTAEDMDLRGAPKEVEFRGQSGANAGLQVLTAEEGQRELNALLGLDLNVPAQLLEDAKEEVAFEKLVEALPPAPTKKDLRAFQRRIKAEARSKTTDIPTIEEDNPWKRGSREHRRYEEKRLSENLRFPPSEFTAERGRVQFGFDPQPITLPEQEVEAFDLDAPTNLPSWARRARSGRDTFTQQYRPPSPDIGDEPTYSPEDLSLFRAGGRSLLNERTGELRKEDEVRGEPLLPQDVVDVESLVSTKQVVAANPEVQVVSLPETLETTTTAGSTGAGEPVAKPKKKKLTRYEKRKLGLLKKEKKAAAAAAPPPPPPQAQSAADFFGFQEDVGFAGIGDIQSTAEQIEERELRGAGAGGVVFEGFED